MLQWMREAHLSVLSGQHVLAASFFHTDSEKHGFNKDAAKSGEFPLLRDGVDALFCEQCVPQPVFVVKCSISFIALLPCCIYLKQSKRGLVVAKHESTRTQ